MVRSGRRHHKPDRIPLFVVQDGRNVRLPDVGRVFAGNFGNGDGTFFVKMEKIW